MRPFLYVFGAFAFCFISVHCSQKPAEEQAEKRMPVIQSEEVNYVADSLNFKGWIAWDSTIHEKRPGVIVVHEWWGHNDYTRHRASMLAEMGYTAFAIDMFGEGKQADHPDSAMAFVQQALTSAEGSKSRFEKAVEVLRNHPTVRSSDISAIGYCFGGGVVLEMARAGGDLDCVISFHGALSTENPVKAGVVKSKVLVLTGAADPMIPVDQVRAFETEMQSGGVDYRVISYPDATHAFTNPAADSVGRKFGIPVAYNMQADTASWHELQTFLAACYPQGPNQ